MAEPESAGMVFKDAPHMLTGHSIFSGIGSEFSVMKSAYSIRSANPDVARAVLKDRVYLIVGQTVTHGIGLDGACRCELIQPAALGTDPYIAVTVFDHAPSIVVSRPFFGIVQFYFPIFFVSPQPGIHGYP